MEKIVVVGAGTMGAGIAFEAARAGFAVDLIDPDPGAQDRAKARIARDAQRAGDTAISERVNYFASVPQGSPAQLGIEAVPERLDLKRAVFADLASCLPRDAVLATNTSSLAVAEIAQGVAGPERVIGLHFFNPVPMMQLVEIVRADRSADASLEAARSFVCRLGKTPVLASDTPGFIVNRVARPYYLQALRVCSAGVAPAEELDRLARGAGFRMGPFELMDLIGLDVNLATSESVYERTGAARLEPVALQRDLVAQGRLGRKSGSGFYEYADGPRKHEPDAVATSPERDAHERIVVIGYAGLALELRELLDGRYDHVELWENEETLDEIPLDTTIVIDVGDGASDRSAVIGALDTLLPRESAIFADAYATDISALARRLQFPERVVGYGILAALENQRVVEIVDAQETGDDALELAQELFESIGHGVALVEDGPGLFLGRTVGSIVNEAVHALDEGIASADDIDLAMRLGTNYPQGPLAWGREIGGDRITRILARLAKAEGAAFAPHRAIRLLDVPEEIEEEAVLDAGA